MSTSSATPPATRRIARSYLTDLVSVTPGVFGPEAISEQLLEHATSVRQMRRPDRLVLTFDLADDPASWSTQTPGSRMPGTAEPAVVDGRDAAGTDDPWTAPLAGNIEVRNPENRDYPGQPGERL